MIQNSRRLICLVLAAFMMAALLPAALSENAAATGEKLGVTTMSDVNIRVAPSMRDRLLFKLAKNAVVTVIGETDNDGYHWYIIKAQDPESSSSYYYTGYVRGDCFRLLSEGETGLITPPPSSLVSNNVPAPEGATGTINAYGVNFRVAPLKTSIQQLNKGDIVKLLTVPPFVSRQTWYQVEYNGVQGYVMSIFLDPSGTGDVTPTATPAPDPSVPTPTVTVNPNPTVTPTAGPDNPDIVGYVMTIKGSVNIRASINGTALRQVGIYVTMPYLLEPVRRGNYSWYFVQTDTGVKGYVRSDCVKVVKGPNPTATPQPGIITPTPQPGIITPTPQPGIITPTPQPGTPTGYVKTTIDYVNVRKGVWGDLVYVVPKANTVFPYFGEPKVSGKTKWYNILGDFGYAWIHGGYVKETSDTGDPTPVPTAVPTATPAPVVTVTSAPVNPTPSADPLQPTPTPGPTAGPDSHKNEAEYVTLRPGSSGSGVKNLVTELKNQGYFKGNVTSNYTSTVENAVRAFQQAQGLAVDGIAGSATQHALFNTVPIGTGDRDDLTMEFYPAEKIDWFTGGIQELLPRGSNFKLYDVQTGIILWVHRWAGGSHMDIETLTKADTARLCRIYGVSRASDIKENTHYQRRPCLVTVGSRTFACSLYGVPHNPDGDTIADNDMIGQICLHFTNSKGHGSKIVDSEHQKAIEYAWLNAPNGHK